MHTVSVCIRTYIQTPKGIITRAEGGMYGRRQTKNIY